MKNVEYKKKIYSLLYNNPLLPIDEKKEIKVLIIADEEVESVELFKAVLWAGQYPDAELDITVCTSDSDGYKEKLASEMPHLHKIIEKETTIEKLAEVSFKNSGDLANEEYDYVVVSGTENIGCKTENVLRVSETEESTELRILAENINFAYELYANERANFAEVSDNVTEENLMSSYASAVHIPIKLRSCESYIEGEETTEEILVKAINAGKSKKEDCYKDLYNELVVLEHRRWMAYAISEGWKQPDKAVLDTYLYQKGNNHQDKTGKYHACLYPCAEHKGELTSKFNRIFKGELGVDTIETLDDVSLYCYQKLCENSEKIDIKKFSNQVGESLYHAIEQLLGDVDNSTKVYKQELEKIKNFSNVHDSIKQKLEVVEERNKKTNFFDIDAQLINFIPFCLWYRRKYKTVITLTNGNPIDAIATPLLLPVQKAIFIGENKKNEKDKIKSFFDEYYYKKPEYKSNLKVSYKNIQSNNKNITNYRDALEEAIKTVENQKEKSEKDIVINILPDSDPVAFIVAGEYSDVYPIVSYDDAGIKCYNGKMNEYYKIGDRNLTADECMKLCNWEVSEQGKEVIPYKECTGLEEIFWDTSEKKGKKPHLYTIWQKMFECYDNKRKSTLEKEEIENGGAAKLNLPQNPEFYAEELYDDLKKFLEKLEALNIVENLVCAGAEGKTTQGKAYKYLNGNFKVKNVNIYRCLNEKSGTLFENILYYKCKYSGLFNEVKTGVKIRVKDTDTNETTNNEIDLIAVNGMKPIFISCKTTAELKNEYIYEIHSEAKLFGGIPVMAVSQTTFKDLPFVKRAKDWGVSLLDAKILKNDTYFNDAVKRILKGNIVSPSDIQYS